MKIDDLLNGERVASNTLEIDPEISQKIVASAAETATHLDTPQAPTEFSYNNLAIPVPTNLSERTHQVEYLSLAAALEWKKASKKVKKHTRIPPLPSAHLLDELK